jgi:hypothetical protein
MEERFIEVSLPVKNMKSIFEGLDNFIKGEELEGDN